MDINTLRDNGVENDGFYSCNVFNSEVNSWICKSLDIPLVTIGLIHKIITMKEDIVRLDESLR